MFGWFGNGTWRPVGASAAVLASCALVYLLVRAVLPILARLTTSSRLQWDDIAADRRVRHRIAFLAPAIMLYVGTRQFADLPAPEFWDRATTALLIIGCALVVAGLAHAANTVYERGEQSRDRPIEAYIQLFEIVVYAFATVLAIAALLKESPWFFMSGLGAIMALLLLIFRDTILSFVASIQLVQKDRLDVGDWIEVSRFSADGIVTDIDLHTVTVTNFDRSIVCIPSHALAANSYRSWRNVEVSGRRLIERSISLDAASVRFLTGDEIDRFARFEPLHEYMARKLAELTIDASRSAVAGLDPDRRRLTNIGTFRAYVDRYLRGHEFIDSESLPFVIRQLAPGPFGIPIEIHAFAKTADWAEFESIQADIFDHLLAMAPTFGLRVFGQAPTEPRAVSMVARALEGNAR